MHRLVFEFHQASAYRLFTTHHSLDPVDNSPRSMLRLFLHDLLNPVPVDFFAFVTLKTKVVNMVLHHRLDEVIRHLVV